jgi:hypothetical protein
MNSTLIPLSKCSLVLVSFAVILSGQVLAQPVEASEVIDEIVVLAKPLRRYRAEIEVERDEMIRLFNEASAGGEYDVRCRYEAPTGSRIPVRVCFSAAQERASADGARDFLQALGLSSRDRRRGSRKPPARRRTRRLPRALRCSDSKTNGDA